MITSINAVEISKDAIRISGDNLEKLLTQEDLFEDAEAEPVTFVFPRDEHRISAMKYLYKVVSSQKCCKDLHSMGEKLEALAKNHCIISLSENFLER